MEIMEALKNSLIFTVVLAIIGAMFVSGFIGFVWVLGKFVS